MACSKVSPQKALSALKPSQTVGLSGDKKIEQNFSFVRCGQTTPPDFPFGKRGMGDDIEMAIQHAPHPTLHSII